jgi:inorganic triphosphatase YgiF
MDDPIERELKLVPTDAGLLDSLSVVDQLGPFVAKGRHHEVQHNSFFDNPSQGLRRERVGFRKRSIHGERLARWTIKGDSKHVGGVASRSEIELQLDADMPPAMALSTLRAAARSRGAVALAEAVDAALNAGGLPLAKPFLETETERRIVDLVDGDCVIELALDRVRIVGHQYAEIEIEAELKRGDESALVAAREAIEALGEVRDSEGSKLSRAVAHIDACDCAT